MKSAILFALFGLTILISVYFTYQRSFTWKNFEMTNSEETGESTTDSSPIPPAKE